MDKDLLLNIQKLILNSKNRNWEGKHGGYYRKGYMDAISNIEKIINNSTASVKRNK